MRQVPRKGLDAQRGHQLFEIHIYIIILLRSYLNLFILIKRNGFVKNIILCKQILYSQERKDYLCQKY
jgi:hypothetical protein